MTPHHTPHGRLHTSHRTRSRRVRFGVLSILLLAAVTASALLTSAIANRYAVRLDVTQARQHSLSGRTRTIINQLEHPVEIVVVADDQRIDAVAKQRVSDLLDALGRASDDLTITPINPVTDAGRARFDALRQRVAGLYQEDTDRRVAAIARAAAAASKLADQLNSLAGALLSLQAPLTDAGDPLAPEIESVAAIARQQGQSLAPLAAAATAATAATPTKPPDLSVLESSRTALSAALASRRDQLASFTKELTAAATRAQPDSPLADRWRRTIQLAQRIRDQAAVGADTLDRLGPSEADVVQRILESADAVLLLSEGRSTAIPFASLFPGAQRLNDSPNARDTQRFLGEELITTALASLSQPTTPIVVLTHNLPGRLLDDSGAAASPQAKQAVGAMLDRLHLRGMTAAEWPVALSPSRPTFAAIDPDHARPIVWFAFGTEGASADASGRFDAYTKALAGLLADGQSVAVSVAPSTRPASGADDPVALALRAVGIDADTGRPLIRRVEFSTGQAFDLSFVIRQGNADSTLGDSITGLPTMLTWVTPIRPIVDPDASTSSHTVFSIEASSDTWAEAEWLAYASAPDDRAWASQSPITPDTRFDEVAGPWSIAASVSRSFGPTGTEQRVVAIGSPGWFFNRLADRTAASQGRQTQLYPGNLELLESTIYWLAGQDDMIAPGARSASVPRIAVMSDATLALARWTLILGLPAATLLLGAIVRLTILR